MSAPRVAVVTGGSAGIGRSVAEVLAREGWRVVACARRLDAAEELLGAGIALERCDVADALSVASFVETVRERYGAVAAIVNCAGIVLPRRNFVETSDADMEELFAINVFGTLRVTRALLPLMSDGGTIVNLSSTLASRPRPGSALYAATKGAIERFSTALATEVASQQIRVHVVAPALVRSRIWLEAGMSGEAYDALLASRGKDFPLGRAGEPEDVSELIAFLVSSRANWMTGTAIQVDGGAMLR